MSVTEISYFTKQKGGEIVVCVGGGGGGVAEFFIGHGEERVRTTGVEKPFHLSLLSPQEWLHLTPTQTFHWVCFTLV